MRLGRFMNVEFKEHNVSISTGVSSTATIQALTNIAQGDTTNTRDGSSIKLASIGFKGRIEFDVSNATATMVRIMLVHDRQTNQAIYAASDLLVTSGVNTNRNLDNGRRFRVLMDKTYSLSDFNPIIPIKYYKRSYPIHIRFDNAAAAITSLTENSLSVFLISNEATNTPTVIMNWRIRYVDN